MAHIAWIGAGLLGAGFVEAALARGLGVTVWNRTVAKAKALEAHGARVASSLEEAVAGVERVHLCLSDDAAVDAVLDRMAAFCDRVRSRLGSMDGVERQRLLQLVMDRVIVKEWRWRCAT